MSVVGGEDLEAVLGDGETLRFQAPLRRGGRVAVTDDRLLLVTGRERVSVRLDAVDEVTLQSFDWYLALLSLVLVGFGLLSLERSVLGGTAFAGAGLASLYWTYRKRNRVQVHVADRRNPVTCYAEDPDELYDALDRAFRRAEERLERRATTAAPGEH